jgi:hypothetical protein
MALIPEVMIPLIGTAKELEILRAQSEKEILDVQKETGVKFDYLDRHNDRASARGADGRRNRRLRGLLQLWYQRSHADGVRAVAG